MMPPVMPPIAGTRADIVPEPPATVLSYDQSAQLMNDMTFRGRVKVACLKFASYISTEDAGIPAHSTRARWAANCFTQPDQVAMQVQPPCVMDGAVQSAGSGIEDEALQSAVETTVNKML